MTEYLSWVLPTLGFVSLIGMQWKTNSDLRKDTNAKEKELDAKVTRVYSRLDEVKECNKKDFVSQPVCDVKYSGTIKKLDEISADVKLILQNGKK